MCTIALCLCRAALLLRAALHRGLLVTVISMHVSLLCWEQSRLCTGSLHTVFSEGIAESIAGPQHNRGFCWQ